MLEIPHCYLNNRPRDADRLLILVFYRFRVWVGLFHDQPKRPSDLGGSVWGFPQHSSVYYWPVYQQWSVQVDPAEWTSHASSPWLRRNGTEHSSKPCRVPLLLLVYRFYLGITNTFSEYNISKLSSVQFTVVLVLSHYVMNVCKFSMEIFLTLNWWCKILSLTWMHLHMFLWLVILPCPITLKTRPHRCMTLACHLPTCHLVPLLCLQGPEHSSARPERFLQMSNDDHEYFPVSTPWPPSPSPIVK